MLLGYLVYSVLVLVIWLSRFTGWCVDSVSPTKEDRAQHRWAVWGQTKVADSPSFPLFSTVEKTINQLLPATVLPADISNAHLQTPSVSPPNTPTSQTPQPPTPHHDTMIASPLDTPLSTAVLPQVPLSIQRSPSSPLTSSVAHPTSLHMPSHPLTRPVVQQHPRCPQNAVLAKTQRVPMPVSQDPTPQSHASTFFHSPMHTPQLVTSPHHPPTLPPVHPTWHPPHWTPPASHATFHLPLTPQSPETYIPPSPVVKEGCSSYAPSYPLPYPYPAAVHSTPVANPQKKPSYQRELSQPVQHRGLSQPQYAHSPPSVRHHVRVKSEPPEDEVVPVTYIADHTESPDSETAVSLTQPTRGRRRRPGVADSPTRPRRTTRTNSARRV